MRRQRLMPLAGGVLALGLFAGNAEALPAVGIEKGKSLAAASGVDQVHWRWRQHHFFFPRVYGYYYNPYRTYWGYPSYRLRYCPRPSYRYSY